MKKLLLALTLIVGSLGYMFVLRGTAEGHTAAAPVTPITTVTDTSSTATPTGETATVSVSPVTIPKVTPPAPPVHSAAAFKDGTYTGKSADAYYGYVQVAAVIAGGKLTQVKVLQYPNDRTTSIEINQQALPMLIEEAISAQSSRIDGISGASDTSPAFVESLASALAKAKA